MSGYDFWLDRLCSLLEVRLICFLLNGKKVFLGSTNSINLKEERHCTEEKKRTIRSQRTLGCTLLAASFAQCDSPRTKDLLSGPVRFYITRGDNWWACSRIACLNRQPELRSCVLLLLFSSLLPAKIRLFSRTSASADEDAVIVLLLKYTTSSIPEKKEDLPGACANEKKCKRESRRWSKIKR